MRLNNPQTMVYGSGVRDINQRVQPGVIAHVRGPRTRACLQKAGCYCYPLYGDPGLLLPLYYDPRGSIKKKYDLGIIAHYIHYKKLSAMYKNKPRICVIKLRDWSVEKVVRQILACKKTVSSSLHGLIVSDAYGIPNKWVKFDNKICGDDTKYYDYFASVSRVDRKPINCMGFKPLPKDIMKKIGPVRIKFNPQELKSHMFFDEHGLTNYTKYLHVMMKNGIITPQNYC